MNDFKRNQWFDKHGLPHNSLDKFNKAENWWDPIKTILDMQIILTCSWEFYVKFRGDEYFIYSEWDCYSIYFSNGDYLLYETDDLDDFGENARIGMSGEFYLKDVIGELKF